MGSPVENIAGGTFICKLSRTISDWFISLLLFCVAYTINFICLTIYKTFHYNGLCMMILFTNDNCK